MLRVVHLGLAVCVAIFLVGCGGGQTAVKLGKVAGEVNLDSKPLKEGEIYFEMLGKPPRLLPVTEGKFTGEAEVGKNKVKVFVYREGTLPPSATTKEVSKENYIPARYNTETTMEVEIKAEGNSGLKYDVQSK